MRLLDYLDPALIQLNLQAENKEKVLSGLVDLLVAAGTLKNRDEVLATLQEREGLGSTGIGHGVAIVGDALFAGSIGRTDLPGGDAETLLNSIRERLLTLPDATVVYAGHGPATTIGEERRSNPFLAGTYRPV